MVPVDEHRGVMNVRVVSIALLLVLSVVYQAMAEEASVLDRATEAWRKGDSEAALKLVEPALTAVDGSMRELHELYQNIQIFHERKAALVQKYRKWLDEDSSPTAYYLLARITSNLVEKERLLRDGLAEN